MKEKVEKLGGAFLAGALLPVLFVVWLGLTNEGFASLGFLLYPGLETWLQLALFALFAVLLWRSFPVFPGRAVRFVRSAPAPNLIASLAGVAFASTVLYSVGVGEAPWRKFYTYVVAPRAVSAWLLGAVVVLLFQAPQTQNERA